LIISGISCRSELTVLHIKAVLSLDYNFLACFCFDFKGRATGNRMSRHDNQRSIRFISYA